MPTTTKDGLLEAWVTQLEAMEQNLEALYGPPGITPTLPPLTTYDGMLEAIAGEAEKACINIAKLYNAYKTDDVTAYSFSVPAGMMVWSGITRLGGRTIVWNQLNSNNQSTATSSGVKFTNNGDGSWTINGTATGTNSIWFNSVTNMVVNDKYYLQGCPAGGGAATYWLGFNGSRDDVGSGGFFTPTITTGRFRFDFINGKSFDNVTTYPYYQDLTLMFGSGNEPATVADVKAMFPAGYYPYSAKTLMDLAPTRIISKDSNGVVLQTYDVPAEVQALTGYGWSCPNATNYIDFAAKKFVQNVGSRAYASGDSSDSTVVTDGTNTHYVLDTPVETDISAYLTGKIIDKVEAGGTIVFENNQGDNYRVPVPITAEYVAL